MNNSERAGFRQSPRWGGGDWYVVKDQRDVAGLNGHVLGGVGHSVGPFKRCQRAVVKRPKGAGLVSMVVIRALGVNRGYGRREAVLWGLNRGHVSALLQSTYTSNSHGVWRSLVAHSLWERGAVGSNPATPTSSTGTPVIC